MPLCPALTDPNSIPTGDMPGDKVHITDWHLAAAATLYPALREQLDPVLAAGRAVVAVYGGSGVGKSELGSLLGHALNADGIGAYILSGDNYPRRIPSVNDAERLRVFRHAGVRGLVDAGAYDASVRDALSSLQAAGTDADPAAAAEHPWLPTYLGAVQAFLRQCQGVRVGSVLQAVQLLLGAVHLGLPVLAVTGEI